LEVVGKGGVALRYLVPDQLAHFRPLRQIRVAGVGDTAPLGPRSDRARVHGDHDGDERALVTERHRLPDVRAELELVLDELRGERRPAGERTDILGAFHDHEMAAWVEEARIAGMEPALRIDRLPGRFAVLEVALEHASTAHQDLATIAD